MRDICGKIAAVTGIIVGSSLDGTDPRIIIALTAITVLLIFIAIGGKQCRR